MNFARVLRQRGLKGPLNSADIELLKQNMMTGVSAFVRAESRTTLMRLEGNDPDEVSAPVGRMQLRATAGTDTPSARPLGASEGTRLLIEALAEPEYEAQEKILLQLGKIFDRAGLPTLKVTPIIPPRRGTRHGSAPSAGDRKIPS